MAWLNAVPEPEGQRKPSKASKQSRLERMAKDGIDPQLPDNPVQGLTDVLFEAGPIQQGGMGASPLSSAELRAWQEGTATRLTPWEFQTLRTLSGAYLAELQQAAYPARRPPYGYLQRNPNLSRAIDEALG